MPAHIIRCFSLNIDSTNSTFKIHLLLNPILISKTLIFKRRSYKAPPPDDGDDAPDPDNPDRVLKPLKLKDTIKALSDDVKLVRDYLVCCTPALAKLTIPNIEDPTDAPTPIVLLSTARRIITVPTFDDGDHQNTPLVWTVSKRGLWIAPRLVTF